MRKEEPLGDDRVSGNPPPGFKLQKVANFGTSEPWVARIEIGVPKIAGFVLADKTMRETFPDAWHHVGMKLGEAFTTLMAIRKLAADPDTPLLELSKEYNSLYSLVWAAYKDRWQTAMKVIGFDMAFLFVADTNFENKFAEFAAEHPDLKHDELKELATSERQGWQAQLKGHRNDNIEHRKEGGDLAFFENPKSAEAGFYDVWRAIEDWTIIALDSFVSPPAVIIQIPKSERNPSVPEKFAFGFDQSFFPKTQN